MVIEINKDLDKYQESVAMGLTAKQLVYSIISVAVGGGLVFLLYPYIGLTGSAYVAIPVVAPIALGGFYSYNGMSFYEVMRKKIYFMFCNRTLTYVSTEGEAQIREYELEKQNMEKKKKSGFGIGIKSNTHEEEEASIADKQAAFEESKKKMKKMLILSVMAIVCFVGIAIAYKMGYLDVIKQYLSNK